jgi:N-acetylneuraminate synthase
MDNIRFIAEFTTNPMGNLNLLLRMVREAAYCGCSFIKMQKKDVRTFYNEEKLASPYISPYGKTYSEYRETFEFDEDQFHRFDKECKTHNIDWFATAQDIPSLAFLEQFNLPIYKIASVNVGNENLIREIVAQVPRDKEVVFSTAGATLERIEKTLNMLSSFRKVTILHCIAEYPCPEEHCKLGNITELRKRFESPNVSIGYSGHEEGYKPTLAAIGFGAVMVERHFCISRASFVHHIECSLEPEEYKILVDSVRRVKSLDEMKAWYADLPQEAFSTSFSMSDLEREFIVGQKYGTKYIGKHSEIHA